MKACLDEKRQMRRYDDYVLGKLLDKYERSTVSRGENKRNIAIAYKLNAKDIPEYFDESRMEYENVHSQLLELENAGVITLVWKKRHEGQILEKCVLVQENVKEAYKKAHRVRKSDKEAELLRMVEGYGEQLPAFAEWIRQRLSRGCSVKQYLDIEHPDHAERICYLASRILQNRSAQFLRRFSISCFNDSKIAERDLSAATRIIADFECGGRLRGLSSQEVLEEFLIYRNPSWIMIKGGPWTEMFPGGIGITEEDALNVNWDRKRNVTRVLTIENLTTFHQWKINCSGGEDPATYEETLVIYLGGYANGIKREFLRHIHEAYPAAEFMHYGDIDCGGFRIWKTLSEGTGLIIEPYRMDLETYRKYRESGRELTEHDRILLKEMTEDPFYCGQKELFREMLETGVKLEQEAIG